MKNVYEVEVQQWNRAGQLHEAVVFQVRARDAAHAIERVMKIALANGLANGFLKSRPIEVVKLERIAVLDLEK